MDGGDDLVPCPVCDGRGYLECEDTSEIQCERCGGTGRVPAEAVREGPVV
jgi:DnaJ-class molecular chaperone